MKNRDPLPNRVRDGVLRPEQLTAAEWLALVWRELGGGSWGLPSAPQVACADVIADPSRKALIFCGFRGMAKSTITAGLIPWFWLCDPALKVRVISENLDKAEKISNQIRKLLLTMPALAHLRPRNNDRKGRAGFDLGIDSLAQVESLVALGILGGNVGGRADIIVLDDVETPSTCETQGMREKLWDRVCDLKNMLHPEGPRRIIVLGTPHSENSIYWRMVRELGFELIVFPAEYPSEDLERFHGSTLHPKLAADLLRDPTLRGKPTDTQRFGEAVLADIKRGIGGADNWARQYMLDPRTSDAARYPLKLSDLLVMDLDVQYGPRIALYSRAPQHVVPGMENFNTGFDGDRFYAPANLEGIEVAPYDQKVMVVDPSGGGLDETAFVVGAWSNGYLCILEWGGNTWWGDAIDGLSDSTLERLVQIADEWKCQSIHCEKKFGGGAFTQLLLAKARSLGSNIPVVDLEIPQQLKERRTIANIRPMLAQHRIILNRRIIEDDWRQGMRGGESKHGRYRALFQLSHAREEVRSLAADDRVDVLAMLCWHFRDRTSIDAAEMERRREEEALKVAYKRTLPKGAKDPFETGVPARGGAPRVEPSIYTSGVTIRRGRGMSAPVDGPWDVRRR